MHALLSFFPGLPISPCRIPSLTSSSALGRCCSACWSLSCQTAQILDRSACWRAKSAYLELGSLQLLLGGDERRRETFIIYLEVYDKSKAICHQKAIIEARLSEYYARLARFCQVADRGAFRAVSLLLCPATGVSRVD
jgi:hypothetical protein